MERDREVPGAAGLPLDPRRGANPPLGLVRDQLRGVARLVQPHAVAVPGVFEGAGAVFVALGIGGAGERAIGMVEAVGIRTPLRPRAEMPLADLTGGIAERLERRGECDRARREGAEIARGDCLRPESARVAAGHEGGAGGGADGLHVVAVEFHALADEPVHAGRFARAPVPADVSPAEVVGHDEQDVGPRRLGGLRGGGRAGRDDSGGEPGGRASAVRRHWSWYPQDRRRRGARSCRPVYRWAAGRQGVAPSVTRPYGIEDRGRCRCRRGGRCRSIVRWGVAERCRSWASWRSSSV